MSGEKAHSLILHNEGQESVIAFYKFIGDEGLCDEIHHGAKRIHFIVKDTSDPARVDRLLALYNSFPWPEGE